MTQQCFIREVLGDGVPPKVAEVMCELLWGGVWLIMYTHRCAYTNVPIEIYKQI